MNKPPAPPSRIYNSFGSKILNQSELDAYKIASEQWSKDFKKNNSHLEIIKKLWAIIDDIDTYGDMAKQDDKLYRSLVERRQKDRWDTGITTDGYELKVPGE